LGVWRRSLTREKPAFPAHFRFSWGGRRNAGVAGWRRSADRTRLQADSLLTGNLSGIFPISEPEDRVSEQETAVLQPFLTQFPAKLIRENIFENREPKNQEQGIKLQKRTTREIWLSAPPRVWPPTNRPAINSRPRNHEPRMNGSFAPQAADQKRPLG
jgi:hypothetical protein